MKKKETLRFNAGLSTFAVAPLTFFFLFIFFPQKACGNISPIEQVYHYFEARRIFLPFFSHLYWTNIVTCFARETLHPVLFSKK